MHFARLGALFLEVGKKLIPLSPLGVGPALLPEMSELAMAWNTTFVEKLIDGTFAQEVLDKHFVEIGWYSYTRPQLDDYQNAIDHLKDAEAGFDGIPNRAWKRLGSKVAPTFKQVGDWLADGLPAPLDFNFNLGVFIPKPTEDSKSHIKPLYTWPLGLKNTDNKVIGSTFNRSTKYILAKKCWCLRLGSFRRQGLRCHENCSIDLLGFCGCISISGSSLDLHGPRGDRSPSRFRQRCQGQLHQCAVLRGW